MSGIQFSEQELIEQFVSGHNYSQSTMVMSSGETPLLQDYDAESHVVEFEDVARPGLSWARAAAESREALGYYSLHWRSRSSVLLVTICCIAAFLLSSAAFRSSNLRLQAGHGLVENTAMADGLSDFRTASRTGFHFQPAKNFMGDPCAPMFFKGYYHFFYQYNPNGALWDYPSWGHTVSKDLIHWTYLDFILSPSQWYDIGGAWTGSATILQNGTPVILYTGSRPVDPLGPHLDASFYQTQNMALPVDPSDPLLREWRKVDNNPMLYNPDFVSSQDFRDPMTAWLEDDGLWRMVLGSRTNGTDGINAGVAFMYTSTDFWHWELEDTLLHKGNRTGVWECLDFFPVSLERNSEVNTSVHRTEHYSDSSKYVLKASVPLGYGDHFAVGSYSKETHTFTPDDPAIDVGIGLRIDYGGKFYASKSFYDPTTGRRILWGVVSESQTLESQVLQGWSNIQVIPRTIWLDGLVPDRLLQWPIEEVEALRGAKASHQNIELQPTDVVKVGGGEGPQLDILVVFEKPDVSSVVNLSTGAVHFDCNDQVSAVRGIIGPFGLLVHSDEDLTEQTAIFFYISHLKDGGWATGVCNDASRSSLAPGVNRTSYGSQFKVLPTENEFSLRILVDHSIVETFAQGGRMVVTSRVYPSVAIGSKAHTFLFNNGTTPILVKSLDVYQMSSVSFNSI